MNSNRLSTFIHCTRLTSLIIAVVIVIGSLCLYSSNSLPLNITDDIDSTISLTEDNKTWIIQSITDRRLISTLVAAQASIFCPLFILLNSSSSNTKFTESTTTTVCFIEIICQLLMPLGLALSWTFSILFDLKTTNLIGGGMNICLIQDAGCILFGFIYGLKYAIVGLFAIETCLVTLIFIITRYRTPKIQLPLEEDQEKQ